MLKTICKNAVFTMNKYFSVKSRAKRKQGKTRRDIETLNTSY